MDHPLLRWCLILASLVFFHSCLNGVEAKPNSQQQSIPGLTMLEKDALCAVRHFKKQNGSRMGSEGAEEFCESIGFKQRWESMFPGRLELGIGVGGLRALAFKSKVGAQNTLIFAFREFEHDKHDYYIDDDFFQEAAFLGPDFLASRLWGFHLLARVVDWLNFFTRHYLGFDYHKHASAFVDEVLSRGKTARQPVFVGYGFGGSIAMLQSLRLETSHGISFSGHGVKHFADQYGYTFTTKRHTNLVLDTDLVLGEQVTRQCLFEAPELYRMLGETSSVLYDHGFVKVDSVRECTDPK